MNLLLINHYVGGGEYGMEYRPYYLAKEWVKMGHTVYLVGATYSHLRLKNPQVSRDLTVENREGINYIWVKTPAYVGSMKRIVNMATFVGKLECYEKKLAKMCAPDLVIASSTYPIDIYPARKIAKRAGAKLCYEVHDLWPLSPMLIGGYSPKHPFIRVMQKGEDYCYKYSDKVISLLWNSEEHMREHGLAPGKFACVPNGFSKDEWSEDAATQPLPEEHQKAFEGLTGKVIVGFAGGFAASGALDTLINAAAILKDRNDIHFVLVGKGPEKEHIEQMVADKALDNVTILPAVAKKLIPAINARFDITYMGGVHSILHKYGTSYNKMTDSMLSGKPIIQAVDEPGCVAERVGCGIQVEAENPQLVADAVVKLVSMPVEERIAMGTKGNAYAKKNLEWGTLASDFLKVFE